MDLSQECPRNETREAIQNVTVAAFGITLQGASHKQSTPPVPCQDYHALRWMEKEGIFLAAIADGVGSCPLSHWGALTAVNTALAGGGAAGDIVIPVYIGGDMIDEIVVTAQQRMNLRSGGR